MRRRMLYEEVIVLGTWKIALRVLEHAESLKNIYGYRLLYINNGRTIYNAGRDFVQGRDVEYREIYEKEELTKFFCTKTRYTLIISAGNFYLFPKEVIQKENLSIINFHNSILPDYPGMNAPSWVIFNGEKKTGITWHYVSTGIDDGDIIHREYCAIDSDEKAYHLVEKLMQLGITGFKKCFQNILDGTVISVPQNIVDSRRIYYAKEVPGNARCFSDAAGEDIYRLLRSLDYGKSNIFPAVTLLHEGKTFKVLRYKKVEKPPMVNGTDTMCLALSGGTYLQIKYKECYQI